MVGIEAYQRRSISVQCINSDSNVGNVVDLQDTREKFWVGYACPRNQHGAVGRFQEYNLIANQINVPKLGYLAPSVSV